MAGRGSSVVDGSEDRALLYEFHHRVSIKFANEMRQHPDCYDTAPCPTCGESILCLTRVCPHCEREVCSGLLFDVMQGRRAEQA